MPRTARNLLDGGTYHVLTRGNNGQPVFHHDTDFTRYLYLLAEYTQQHQLKIFHYALMPNHVHLVMQISQGEALSKAMLGLNLTYSLFYRKRYRYHGHLWQGRFKSLFIERDDYLLACGRYVELNPVRAGLVQDPAIYAWSSYRAYAIGAENPLVTRSPIYESLGLTASERQYQYRHLILDDMNTPREPQLPFADGRIRIMPLPQRTLEDILGLRKAGRGRPNKEIPVHSHEK